MITAVVVEGRSQAETARAYRVSKGWVCKLVVRYRAEGEAAFEPKSRRPYTSPNAIGPAVLELVVAVRKDLAERGLDAGPDTIGWHLQHTHHITISRATIARHLAAQGLVTPEPSKRPKSSYIRFQAEQPNEGWQADFTHYRLTHPDGRPGPDAEILTWLDDHSRYALSVTAHPRVTGPIVLRTFRETVAAHGIPASTLTDNGMVFTTRRSGYNGMTQRISPSAIPRQVREFLEDKGIDLETAVLCGGIGELEAMASRGKSEHWLMPPWADVIAEVLSKYSVDQSSTRVEAVFWPLSDAALHGLLVKVRTALAELVAELVALTPTAQDVPDRAAADQAVYLVVNGHRPRIQVTAQHAPGGKNVAVNPAEGSPVTVASGTSSAIGSQIASGSGSSVVGSQTARRQNALAGRDGAASDSSSGQSWWARLRKRGWVVAITTILGGIAGVAAAILALLTWLDWTPWWQ